jgi:GNAT superfamily N-acetyltransferase
MTIQQRDFHWNEDFELVRNFLIEIFNEAKSLNNMIPSRFENRKFGPCGPEYTDEDDKLVKIWEETDRSKERKVIAVTILDTSPVSYLNLHPEYAHVEKDIVLTMEQQKKEMGKTDDGEVRIAFVTPTSHTQRQELLKELGYENLGNYGHNRIRPVDLDVPDYHLPDGYSIKHADVAVEFDKYHEVIGSVFSHCGKYMTEKMAKIYSEASFYHDGMDLVVVAPDGNFAAFTTIRIDPVSGITEFEPVGTHPDHRKLGLAKSIILEGLKRLEKHTPSFVCIPEAADNEGATKLYDSLGFSRENLHVWRKYL